MRNLDNKSVWKQKGFYLAAGMGVVVLGVIAMLGVTVMNSGKEPGPSNSGYEVAERKPTPTKNETHVEKMEEMHNEESLQVSDKDDAFQKDAVSDVAKVETDKKSKEPVWADEEKSEERKKDAREKKRKEEPSVETSAKTLVFEEEKGLIWPVQGDILLKYSEEKGIYFHTLAQYKTNPAMLIAAKEGAKVKSAANGVVTNVREDEELGKVMTVSLGEGKNGDEYIAEYGNLKDVKVAVGERVEEGQVLAKVAEPTKYYSKDGIGLYFRIRCGEKNLDPLLFLP
ncbi:MAG: M23 family metallopeptidase [Lachnospiraceae bacterium]|nr:M23 family metallopeptidase [Lachnospiraceae bacterium]